MQAVFDNQVNANLLGGFSPFNKLYSQHYEKFKFKDYSYGFFPENIKFC